MSIGAVSRKSPWLVGSIAVVILVVAVMLASGGWISPFAKQAVIRALKQRYQSDVEIQSLDVSLFPYPHGTGRGLVFRKSGNKDAPPLIKLDGFTAVAGWFGLLARPHRVKYVRLEGLEIQVQFQGHKHEPGLRAKPPSGLLIEHMDADGTVLRVFPKTQGKQPLTFHIYKLSLHTVSGHAAMSYRAELHNAKPPGLIDAAGDFGPWDAEDPAGTPVSGKYRFSNADLGVFKGISGELSSRGQFHGELGKIEVNGETDTPDFAVSIAGHPVDLKTTFNATVDGENGDTFLHPVKARFGQTTVVCQGAVAGEPDAKGKTVSLNSVVQNGELADVLRLAVKSDLAPMTGRISFHSEIRIPPGHGEIPERLYLNGQFDLQSTKFTNPMLERRISKLSARAQGNTENDGDGATASNMRGTFLLDDGVLTLHGLSFQMPWATVSLNGTYGLRGESLDFHGALTMDAKLSQMTTGVKSFLLKALDPLFTTSKAGAVIPFHIGGTREHPRVGLGLRRK